MCSQVIFFFLEWNSLHLKKLTPARSHNIITGKRDYWELWWCSHLSWNNKLWVSCTVSTSSFFNLTCSKPGALKIPVNILEAIIIPYWWLMPNSSWFFHYSPPCGSSLHSPAGRPYASFLCSSQPLAYGFSQCIPIEFCSSRYSLSPSLLCSLSVCLSVSLILIRGFFIIILFLRGLKPDPVE